MRTFSAPSSVTEIEQKKYKIQSPFFFACNFTHTPLILGRSANCDVNRSVIFDRHFFFFYMVTLKLSPCRYQKGIVTVCLKWNKDNRITTKRSSERNLLSKKDLLVASWQNKSLWRIKGNFWLLPVNLQTR